MAQLTSQDLDKLRKSMEQASQPKVSKPIPTLTTPKGKTFDDKSLDSLRQNIKIHDQKVNEEKQKTTNTPAKNRTVPKSVKEVRKEQLANGTDPASMSIKESEQKKKVKNLNNIARQTGTTDVQQYAKRFNFDPTVHKELDYDALDAEAKAIQDKGTSATIAEQNRLREIYDLVEEDKKKKADMANSAERRKKAKNVKSDILDDNTLATMDARAKQLQAIDARTPKENDELQAIYDKKEKHDKAVEKEKRLNGENHVVNNTRYNQLMSNQRLANDIDTLVDVIYNNANQDATVSPEWAANEGAKNITGGYTKDQFIDQLSKRYELTKDELLDMALTRKTDKQNIEMGQYRDDLNTFGSQHPVLGSAASFVGTVGGLGEGAYNMLANGITGDERYTSRIFDTTKEGLREGAKTNIDSDLGKTAYDIGMGVGDMGVGALMGSAPAVLAGNTANRTLINSVDNGIDPRQAALYAGLTGVTDYVANRIGLDKAKELAVKSITAEGVKGALAKNAIAGLGEAGENVLQDVAQAFVDRVINGDDAELNQAFNNLVAQGYSEEDAFKEVAKQFGQQELVSAAQGYAMGSVMNAGQSTVNGAKTDIPVLKSEINNGYETAKNNLDNRLGISQRLNDRNYARQMESLINNNTDEPVNIPRIGDVQTEADWGRFTNNDVKSSGLSDVDNVKNVQYNNGTGGIANGEGRITNDGTGSEGILPDANAEGRLDTQNGGVKPTGRGQLSSDSVRRAEQLRKNGGVFTDEELASLNDNTADAKNFYNANTDPELFVDALETAKASNPNGAAVDSHSIEEVNDIIKNGGNLFLLDDGTSGYAVEGNGNLTAVFKNTNNKTPYMGSKIALASTKNGANKGDCFGRTLVNIYSRGGYEPVARMKYAYGFNDAMDAQVKDQLAKGVITKEPDVYALKLRDDFDYKKAVADFNNAKVYTQAELDSLPDYTDVEDGYTRMLSDRDALIKQPANKVASSMPESNPELDDYTARRNAMIEAQQGMSMKEMVDSVKQLKAMDTEMAKTHPEWFRDGKFVGNEVRQDFSNEIDASDDNWTDDETDVTNPNQPNLDVGKNLQFFANKKAELQERLKTENLSDTERAQIEKDIFEIDELLKNMNERFTTDDVNNSQQKISKAVTNSDMRIDAERAAEELSKDIGKYFVQTEEMSFTKGRDKVVNDYEGSLDKYMNNKGDMYDGSDYDAIRILEQDIKNKRKNAQAEGNEELVKKYTEQLDKLAITRQLRSTSSGEFNQAAAKWIRTAEGAIDTAKSIVNGALDEMEKGSEAEKSEAHFIRETADDIEDYAQNFLEQFAEDDELWNELRRGQRRLEFERELHNAIQEIGDRKGIKIEDDLATKLANEILNGQKDAEALARSIAAFRRYNFAGLDEDFLDKVEAMFDEAEQYDYNSKQRVELEDKAYEMLAKEIYKKGGDFQDKFDAWRYFAMLANTKTHERNMIGNFVFADAVNSTSNNLAAAMEGAVDKSVRGLQRLTKKQETGIKRTKAFLNPASKADQDLLASGWNDAVDGVYRELQGHKWQRDVANGIENHKPAFNPNTKGGKALNKAIGINEDLLSAEDFLFKRQKYTSSVAGYLKANGEDASIFGVDKEIKKLLDKKSASALNDSEKAELAELRKREQTLAKARAYAINEAKYATFNQTNEFAQKLSKHSKDWRESKNPVSRFFGREIESLAAFKNTPANILKVIGDYSPKSYATAAAKLYKAISSKDNTKNARFLGKTISGSTVSDALADLSKGLTGHGLMLLGAKLYKDGFLTSSKDDVTGKSDETEGKQAYALNINGASYKIDSFAPVATSLFLGAEAYKILEDNRGKSAEDIFFNENGGFNYDLINDVIDSSLAVAEPVIDQSMLQGLSNTIENVRYAQSTGEALMSALVAPQIGYYSQAIPTLGGQIARTADNTRRSLRTETEGVAGSLERAGRQVLNKLPVLNKKNTAYRDMWGETQENYEGNLAQRAVYQTLTPWFKQKLETKPYQAELDRLYQETKNADVLNESFPNKIDGVRLSNDEYDRAQDKAGHSLQDFINETLKNSNYQNLSADEQVEVQKSLQTLAKNLGIREVRPDKKINDDLFSSFNGKNYGEIVNMAVDDAKSKVRNAEIKESGLPVNDQTKELFDNNDVAGQQRYKDALAIAKNYGFDTLSKEEWQTYNVKGASALYNELSSKKAAKDLGVTNSNAFKESLANGTSYQYADAYNAISTTKTGTDDLGNNTYLEYNDTTRKIYDDKGQTGLNNYATLKSKLPEGSNKDKDYISALNSSGLSQSDKAYFFVLHKGKDIAKNAPTNPEDAYAWYQVKSYYDTDGKSGLSKAEKTALYRGVHDYLVSLGYSDAKAKEAQSWTWK